MAQRVTIKLEDDLQGGPADETVKFGLGGSDYEIDLSTKNASAFRQRIAPYIEHARKAAGGPRRRTSRATAGRERSGDIRSWAKERGIHVSERGRIPASVVEQYESATRKS
jgi:Lsr2